MLATKSAEDARAELDRLNAMLTNEQACAQAANAAQRAATLAELGFGEKTEGTAARAAKLLASSELKIDALRVDAADSALVACDKVTRAAEQAIVKAHADNAELNQAVAMEAFAAALLVYHGTEMAAHGTSGQRPDFYGHMTQHAYLADCEKVDRRIKAAAEQGE